MFEHFPQEQLKVMFDEAHAALHKLLLGEKAVVVFVRDKRIEYNQTTVNDLVAYIRALEVAMGAVDRPLYKVASFDV